MMGIFIYRANFPKFRNKYHLTLNEDGNCDLKYFPVRCTLFKYVLK